MKTRHTPGPWTMRAKDSGYSITGNGVSVARIDRTSATGPEQAANARLITASPDLLAALRAYLSDDPETDNARDTIARAAVAKATGVKP